ncbi:hypothetical protein DMH08_39410 [Actinomadura sp. WAC 06369]|nr:hypothetical protein DMH08_39410 [Actinomadura sp. WAC 06369]
MIYKITRENGESGIYQAKGIVDLGFDSTIGKPGQLGYTDSNGYYIDHHGNVYVEVPQSRRSVIGYQEVRDLSGDTENISTNTGITQDVLERVRRHLFFKQHEVAVGPGQTRVGNFSPMHHIAELWAAANDGPLLDSREQFRRLIAHEAIESMLMERGIPYRSSDPAGYTQGGYRPTYEHYGAHDLAPVEDHNKPPWSHYILQGRAELDIDLSDDLSNVTEIVNAIESELP